MFYKLTAEHVNNFSQYVKALDEHDIEVVIVGRDRVLDTFHIVVLDCDEITAEEARELMWEYNGGAYCGMDEISADELDEMM